MWIKAPAITRHCPINTKEEHPSKHLSGPILAIFRPIRNGINILIAPYNEYINPYIVESILNVVSNNYDVSDGLSRQKKYPNKKPMLRDKANHLLLTLIKLGSGFIKLPTKQS